MHKTYNANGYKKQTCFLRWLDLMVQEQGWAKEHEAQGKIGNKY